LRYNIRCFAGDTEEEKELIERAEKEFMKAVEAERKAIDERPTEELEEVKVGSVWT